MYLSPEGLYYKGYGFRLNAQEEMEKTVREIGENKYFWKRGKKFTICKYKYKFDGPSSPPAMVAKIMDYTQYVYALVPKEWITSDDFFGGGRKKKRKYAKRRSTKRKSTKRKSTKRRSKQRKYKKTK